MVYVLSIVESVLLFSFLRLTAGGGRDVIYFSSGIVMRLGLAITMVLAFFAIFIILIG